MRICGYMGLYPGIVCPRQAKDAYMWVYGLVPRYCVSEASQGMHKGVLKVISAFDLGNKCPTSVAHQPARHEASAVPFLPT